MNLTCWLYGSGGGGDEYGGGGGRDGSDDGGVNGGGGCDGGGVNGGGDGGGEYGGGGDGGGGGGDVAVDDSPSQPEPRNSDSPIPKSSLMIGFLDSGWVGKYDCILLSNTEYPLVFRWIVSFS